MKKTLCILWLSQSFILAQWTMLYSTPTGSPLNGGSDTNDAAKITGANGNWTSTTDTFIFAAPVDLSAITTGDAASVYVDGATIATWGAWVVSVVDATDTVVLRSVGTGTKPTTSATGVTMKIGGAWTLPQAASTNRHPMRFTADETFSHIGVGMTNAIGKPVMWNIKGGGDYAVLDYLLPSTTNTAQGPYFIRGWTNEPMDSGFVRIGYDTNIVFAGANTPQTWSGVGGVFIEQVWASGGGANAVGSVHNNGLWNFTTIAEVRRCVFTDSWETATRFAGVGWLCEGNLYVDNQVNAANGKAAIEATTAGTVRGNFIANQEFRPGDNGADGIALAITAAVKVVIEDNTIYNCFGSGINMSGNAANAELVNNSIYKMTLYGITFPLAAYTNQSQINIARNIISTVHTGIRGQTANSNFLYAPFIAQNAFLACTNGNTAFIITNRISGSIQLTVNPWVDADNGNFALNNTSGGGALLRGIGGPVFLNIANQFSAMVSSYRDIGPAQHQETGGTGGGSFTFVQ